jgi:hypothetical protein
MKYAGTVYTDKQKGRNQSRELEVNVNIISREMLGKYSISWPKDSSVSQ